LGSESDTGKKKIAIVDDEPGICFAFSRMITYLGYPDPAVFSNGTSFVNAIARDRQSFDLVLMDYRMPEMNGIEAAKIIQRYRPNTKIILVTGIDTVEEEAESEGLKYLRKPVPMGVLAAYLEVTLGES
jgi:DNA-binding NtrC family response regulator